MIKKRKKKGSATFIVVMLMTVILILSFSLVPLTLAGVKQGNMLFGRNKTYYTGEGTIDKTLHYIDVFSEKARIRAYNKCFTTDKKPNMSNIYIKKMYDEYMASPDTNAGFAIFKINFMNYYKHEFNIAINAFFNDSRDDVVRMVEGNQGSEQQGVLYTWNDVKNSIAVQSEDLTGSAEVFANITESSEFHRFKPEKLNSNDEYMKEFSNIEFYKNELNPLNYINPGITNSIFTDRTLRETFYIKVVDNKNTERYSCVTIDFDPIGRGKVIESEKKENMANGALNYGIISEDNLIAGNNLTVNSSVIVGGQGVPDPTDSTKVVEYGGMIAGVDNNLVEKINNGTPIENIGINSPGNITVNGNAYIGELTKGYGVQGGFVETVNDGSKINITKNSYSHSLVTNDNSSNGEITIGGSAFVADNISLNGIGNNVTINKNIVGYEDGANLEGNYLSSPGIVINNMDETKKSKLTVDGQIALAGEGFVENIKTNYDNKNLLFKTFETTAIFPNYIIYSNYLLSNKFNDFFRQYTIGDSSEEENSTIDLLDKYEVMNLVIENKSSFGIDFILSYFKEYGEDIDPKYDLGYDSLIAPRINIQSGLDNVFEGNMTTHFKEVERKVIIPESNNNTGQDLIGTDIDIIGDEFNGNGSVNDNNEKSPGLNLSYFNYIMYANGDMYSTYDPSIPDVLEPAKQVMNTYLDTSKVDKHNIDIILSSKLYKDNNIGEKFKSIVYPTIKQTLNQRLNMIDVVKYSDLTSAGVYDEYKYKTRLGRCFDWSELDKNGNNGRIEYTKGDVYVLISNEAIKVSDDDLRGKKTVLIVSDKDVVVDALDNTVFNGSIMSKKNIITRGSSVDITANQESAKIISNIDDPRIQNFLRPGLGGSRQSITGISREVNSNIDIISRRQLLN